MRKSFVETQLATVATILLTILWGSNAQAQLPAGQLPPNSGYLPAGQLPGSIGTKAPKTKHTAHKHSSPHKHTTHVKVILPRSIYRRPTVVHTRRHPLYVAPRHRMPAPPLAPTSAATTSPTGVASPSVVNTTSIASPITALPGAVYASGQDTLVFNSDKENRALTVPTVTDLAPGNTPHSIAAWVKVPALPPAGRSWILLLGKSGQKSLSHHWLLHSDGKLQIGPWGGKGVLGAMKAATWTHIATTFDGTLLNLYVNGALVQSLPSQFNLQGVPLTLGKKHGYAIHSFNGELQDVSVYNRALSASEVIALFQARSDLATQGADGAK